MIKNIFFNYPAEKKIDSHVSLLCDMTFETHMEREFLTVNNITFFLALDTAVFRIFLVSSTLGFSGSMT